MHLPLDCRCVCKTHSKRLKDTPQSASLKLVGGSFVCYVMSVYLSNKANTYGNVCTPSYTPARLVESQPSWRVLKHLKKFLDTGEVPTNNRGGTRDGQSLLDCEAFKQKASLWLKEQIALHTQRRLRAIRKSKSFKSQSQLPMEQKTSHALSSARFRAYVEDTLLKEFYSEDAVRARAKSAALAESKLHMNSFLSDVFVFVHNCLCIRFTRYESGGGKIVRASDGRRDFFRTYDHYRQNCT